MLASKFISGYRKLSKINDFVIPSTDAQSRRTCRRGARERERERERKEGGKAKRRRERARGREKNEGNEKKHNRQGAERKEIAETLERVGVGAQARVAATMERQPYQERMPVHYL